jgi:hypothetical protein
VDETTELLIVGALAYFLIFAKTAHSTAPVGSGYNSQPAPQQTSSPNYLGDAIALGTAGLNAFANYEQSSSSSTNGGTTGDEYAGDDTGSYEDPSGGSYA